MTLFAPEAPSGTTPNVAPHSVTLHFEVEIHAHGGVEETQNSGSALPPEPIITPAHLFAALAGWWHEATDPLPPPRKTAHEAYKGIIRHGEVMLPYILADLHERGGDWYEALEKITHENPVAEEDEGIRSRMREQWHEWGREKGHVT